jgi:hypothetical protein
VVIVFALLAALSNAVNEATQHVASIAAPRRSSSGWRLVMYLFRSPLWLFGWVALAGAFVFQALALHDGLISVVQPLLATELVIMLVLRRIWIHQAIQPVTWAAAAWPCLSWPGSPEAAIPPRPVGTGRRPSWPAAPVPRCWPSWLGGDLRGGALLFMPRPLRSCGRWWRRSSRPQPTR